MDKNTNNRWQDQLTNHPIHTTLSSVRGFVTVGFENTTPETEVEKRRLIKIFDRIENILSQLDPEITPFSLLDNLNSGLRHQHIFAQLSNYSSNGNVDHLTTANNTISSHLPIVIQLEALTNKAGQTKSIQSLEEQVDKFIIQISDRQTAISSGHEELEEQNNELKKSLAELSSDIDAKKTEIDKLITAWQHASSDAMKKQDDGYDKWRKETSEDIEARIKKVIKESSDKLSSAHETFTTEIDAYIEEAKSKHQNILDLHEIVAGDSVASGYLQNAKDEKKQANFWRWATIMFIVATATWGVVTSSNILAIITDSEASGVTNGVEHWLKSLSVIGVLIFGAVYSSKQSNLHRNSEQQTRWFALEVKAIDPFIASLNPEEQKELKKNLSEKLFGQMNNMEQNTESPVNEHFLETIMKGIADAIKASKS